MHKTTYLDSWGSGVKRMVDACKADGVPCPRYELRPGGLAIVFDRPKSKSVGVHVLENVTENVLEEIKSKLTERQRLIVQRLIETRTTDVVGHVLENVTETHGSLATYFHVNERTIRRDLSVLQSLGVIKHVGPDKGGKWLVLIPVD